MPRAGPSTTRITQIFASSGKQCLGYPPANLLGAAAAPLMHRQACQAAPGGRAGHDRPNWRALWPGGYAAAAAAKGAAGSAQLHALHALCCAIPGALHAATLLTRGALQGAGKGEAMNWVVVGFFCCTSASHDFSLTIAQSPQASTFCLTHSAWYTQAGSRLVIQEA